MANEISTTFKLAVTNGGLKGEIDINATNPGQAKSSDQTAAGLLNLIVTTSTSEAAVTFSGLTTPGEIALKNLDATNIIQYGPEDSGAMVLLGQVKPGRTNHITLGSSVTLRVKAAAGNPKLQIFALES